MNVTLMDLVTQTHVLLVGIFLFPFNAMGTHDANCIISFYVSILLQPLSV